MKKFFNLVNKFHTILVSQGLTHAIIAILNNLCLTSDGIINRRRLALSKHFNKLFNSTVSYGYFKGMKLPDSYWWSIRDRAPMLFGFYELEVLSYLASIRDSSYKYFIDIGAADGYYAVGVLVAKLFEHSYCFETNINGQEVIKLTSVLNNVSNRISVFGHADKDFYTLLPEGILEKSVVLVDIEGGEFDLLDRNFFNIFSKSIVIVEMHPWLNLNKSANLQELIEVASSSHKHKVLNMSSRDLSGFPEVEKLNDNDRWLLCSEGRGQLMSWVFFEPF